MRTAPRLRARDRRALALGLAILAPVAAYRVGVGPWLGYRGGLHDALVAQRDLLARERTALREAALDPERRTRLAASFAEAEPWMLDGASPLAAAGALSRQITAFGSSAQILIQEIEARETEARGGPVETTALAVQVLGDLEGLVRFLQAIENGRLLLHVTELTLRPAGVNDGDLTRGQLMSAGLVVTGIWFDPETLPSAMRAAGERS